MTPHGYEAVILDAQAGIVVGAPHTETLTILGKGSSARGRVYAKAKGEVWGLNTGALLEAGTRSFQIHPRAILPLGEELWLRFCPVPIYAITYHKNRNDTVVRYPLERVITAFREPFPKPPWLGPVPFASSFDYMLALAILEGFRDITLAGVEYEIGTLRERLAEHVSLAFWVGQARARGIRITIPGRALKFPWLYGYDYWDERAWGQVLGQRLLLSIIGQSGVPLDDGQAKGRAPKRLRRG
jgi:hypothetical protein